MSMKTFSLKLALVFLALLVMQPSSTVAQTLQTSSREKDTTWQLKKLLEQSRAPANFRSVETADVKQFESLLAKTLNLGVECAQTKDGWDQLGWQMRFDVETGILVLIEADDQRQGRGMYAFRVNSKSSLVLQAPHRFYDSLTGIIARKVFEESEVRAVAWNTVHRKTIDIAHTHRHYINAFSRVVLDWDKGIVIAQLHGFSNGNKTGAAKQASIILSDSTRHPGRKVRDAAFKLKESFDRGSVKLYPIEVSQLGGTTNAQAAVAYASGAKSFLHVEMNADFRKQLTKSASTRAAFYSAISDVTPNQ